MTQTGGWSFGVILALLTFISATLTLYGLIPSPYGEIISTALGIGTAAAIYQGATP